MSDYQVERAPYLITTDLAKLDLDTIWGWLRGSYWAAGIPRATVERALRNCLPFGIFEGPRQVGVARVITDRATFAYLADVFIDEGSRGRGLAKWLMATIQSHPDLQGSPALRAGDARRARPLCAVRFPPAGASGGLHGDRPARHLSLHRVVGPPIYR